MYDALIGGLQKRPSATLIHSTHGAVDETYAKLIHALAPEQAEPEKLAKVISAHD